MMGKNNRQWIKKHIADGYVKQAQREKYRSRAVYKLLEINRRDVILHPGMMVVDLGAAPGGWAQLAANIVGTNGTVIAIDKLAMEPIAGVVFLQGDFQERVIHARLRERIEGLKVGLVMSDMAPNISGIKEIDQPRGMYLVELAVEFVHEVLMPGGDLLIKVFQGSGFEELRRGLQRCFDRVLIRKPKASRPRSCESYILARGYNLL